MGERTASASRGGAPGARPERPPSPVRPTLARPRLEGLLVGRFERRLTVLVAGAGFGKTALLQQALAANEDGRMGADLWVACRAGDHVASRLAETLLRAAGAGLGREDPTQAVADAIWRRSPAQVALILDDVHLLESDSPGAALLGRLFHTLPDNAHLVLAGRESPPLPVARLLARGEAVLLEEADLAFDSMEQAGFAALRGVDPAHLGDTGGWPAVVELRASVGEARVPEFLWEEVLERMGTERCRALASLSALEWIDDELVREVVGLDLSAAALVEGLPLTSLDTSGAARLHHLWRPVLARFKEASEPRILRRAARVLCERGDVLRAIDLCLESDDVEILAEQVDEIARANCVALSGDVLADLVDRLPAPVLELAGGQLLQGARFLASDPARSKPFLERAADAYEAAGDRAGALEAIMALARLAFWASDMPATQRLAARAEKLNADDGLPQVVLVARVIGALAAGRLDDASACIEAARACGDTPLSSTLGLLAALVGLESGNPEVTLHETQNLLRRAEPRLRGAALGAGFEARWLLGRFDGADLDDAERRIEATAHGVNQNLAQGHAALASASITLGRFEAAKRMLAEARRLAERAVGPRVAVAIGFAEAQLAVALGDEAAGRERLRSLLEEQPLGPRPVRAYLRGLALLYAFAPQCRRELDALELGACHARAREVGRALVALREAGEAEAAAALDWSEPRALCAILTPDLSVELVTAALSAGAELDASTLMELASNPRPALRRIVEGSGGPSVKTARALLATLPVRPAHRLEIRVLGPLELLRDGAVVDAAGWRRERVRSLLQFLVAHPRATRAAVGVALWPELDDEAVTNNLRVTLSYLQRVLEPDRRPGEPLWFLRAEGEQLGLRLGEPLEIDALRFDALCDRAERADTGGDPRSALSAYLEAVDLYRGDYLEDAGDSQWGEFDRTRLRSRFLRAAVRAGELLLAVGEVERTLTLAARAVAVEDYAESGHRLLALAFRAKGDRAAARSALESCLQRLREAQLEPEPETEDLAASLGLVGS